MKGEWKGLRNDLKHTEMYAAYYTQSTTGVYCTQLRGTLGSNCIQCIAVHQDGGTIIVYANTMETCNVSILHTVHTMTLLI